MSNRLDQKREIELSPKRMDYAIKQLVLKGYRPVVEDSTKLIFERVKGKTVVLFPYSGWWSGKGIGAGRGIDKLLKLL